jgi:ABC-type uncharacterized transport system fused permease/ATPase subunit
MTKLLNHPQVEPLLSDEHFSVDGTLTEAWASQKSFRAKDGSDGDGTNFHGQKRNETHASTTDPESRLYRKAAGRDEELAPQLWMMITAFLNSPGRNNLFLLGIAVCAVVALTAFLQIKLNAWNKPFYDALSRKDAAAFVYQLVIFGVIAGALLALNVAQAWLREMSKLKLREGLTRDLFDQWLVPRRAFRLSTAGEIGENPDQRIHEDARHLVDLSTDLGIGLLQATLLLVCFITVLWDVSESVIFSVAGVRFALPGYMVWLALTYAGIASFASWWVGRPLIALDAERYAREAELRFALVRVNERTEAIALYGGETDEKDQLNRELDQVLLMMRRLVTGITRPDLGHRRLWVVYDRRAIHRGIAWLFCRRYVTRRTDDGGWSLQSGAVGASLVR